MPLPEIDSQSLLDFLTGLLNTPSPTGFTEEAIRYTQDAFAIITGLKVERTNKGALLVTWQGQQNNAPRGLTAHVDTLGAMVKEIKPNGRLKLSKIGGLPWNAVEGEGMHGAYKFRQAHQGLLPVESIIGARLWKKSLRKQAGPGHDGSPPG
jgi:putative aminopeptidase FrvX